jgi:peroxiredoxin Q/BCP
MKTGDLAPDFEAVADDGQPVRLSELLSTGPVVMFFYPGAFTPGCTAETCHFRDLAREFEALGARVVGISSDRVERQAQFARTFGVGFPLLSDPQSKIAASFRVARPGMLPNRRTTFVIDTDRRVLDVIANEINMNVHADRALQALARRPST